MPNLLDTVSKEFKYKIEQGITIELKGFFDRQNDLINKYKIQTTEDGKYIISIIMNEFDKYKARDIFFSLTRFIDYESTFYTHKVDTECTTYYLLSTSLNHNLGFYLILKFFKDEEKFKFKF